MKLHVSSQNRKNEGLRLLPFLENDGIRTQLLRLASLLQAPADWLLRDFQGKSGQILSLYSGKEKIILVGLGKQPGARKIRHTFRTLSHSWIEQDVQVVGLDLRLENIPAPLLASVLTDGVQGLYLGGYQAGQFKSEESARHPLHQSGAELNILCTPDQVALAQKAATQGLLFGETLERIFDMVNRPANYKTPEWMARWARQSGKAFGFRVHILGKAELQEAGFHALLAVNQGSAHDPVLIIMEYRGAEDAPTVGLAGKGVTFDTGGVSIKPSARMHHMKSDMGGAAAVMGTIELAARLELPVHVVGVVPVTDNSVGSHALKPSDVITSYSGKSIEIIDTDAEGRLILADALSYLNRQYRPQQLIDLATLTGSAMSTLGQKAAALFTNHEGLLADLYRAGEQTGERVWRLPLWDDYAEDLHSDVADLRNYSGRPLAGAIGAAKFLEAFTDDHPQWAHLDIAGVAFNDTAFTKMNAASGFGVRLLVHFLEQQHGLI